MITFSDSEKQIINSWLSGSKDYYTKISLVARWNTKIPSDSLIVEGEVLDERTGLSKEANPSRDIELLEQSPLPQEQEIEDIYDVRFKRSGLKQDLSFRSPTLTFVWGGYYSFLSGKPKDAVRFYLKISLVSAGGKQEIVLCKTGFYKIRTAESVYSTSRSSGADYKIEAVPWIYEYNSEMMFGTHGNAWMIPAYNQWDIKTTWDKDIRFFASWNSVFRLQKIKHDLNMLKNGNYPAGPAEYFDDSPCSYTGPFYRETRGGQTEWLSTKKLGRQTICEFIKETPISMIQRYEFELGCVAVTEIYKDENPLDTPMMSFQYLYDLLNLTVPNENMFQEIENSDSEVLLDSLYVYTVINSRVALGSNILAFTKDATVELDTAISGVVELKDLYFELNQSGADELNYPRNMIYSISAYDSDGALLTTSAQFESDGDTVRILYLPGDVTKNIKKFVVNSYLGKVTTKEQNVPTDISRDFMKVRIDTKIDPGTWNSFFTYDVSYLYSNNIKKIVKFNSEFRPWLNIFDPIKVRVMNSFGEYKWVTALLTDIDANIDSFSASYEAIVIKEEENE